MPAPSVVVYKDAYAATSTATNALTQRTVATGDVVAVVVQTEDSAAGMTASSLAKSAGTATIGTVTKQRDAGGSSHCGLVLFTFTVTAGGTLTLTVTWSATPVGRHFTVWTYVATGSGGVGNTAMTTSAASTITASLTTSANSYVLALAGDWGAIGGATTTLTPAGFATPVDAHETDGVVDQSGTGLIMSSRGGHWNDTGSPATTSYGVTVPTSTGYNLVVCELLAGAGGGPDTEWELPQQWGRQRFRRSNRSRPRLQRLPVDIEVGGVAAPVYTRVHSPVWSNSNTTGAALAVTVSPTNIDDIMVVSVLNQGGTSVASLSGGGCTTWTRVGTPWTDPETTPSIMEFWYGVVTSTGSSSLSVTWNAAVGAHFNEITVQDFHCSVSGTWTVEGLANQSNGTSSNTVTYPTVTPSHAPEIYVGYASTPSAVAVSAPLPSGAVVGLTSGNDCFIYHTSYSSGTVQNTVTISNTPSWSIGIGIYMAVAGGPTTWDLAGTASSTSSASGAVSLLDAVAGTASNASTASGAITLTAAIAGTASTASSASGSITLTAVIAGTSPTVSSAAGALTLLAQIAGTAVSTSSATGAFLPAPLAGTASNTSSSTGALTLLATIAGTAPTVSQASGALTLIAVIAGTSSTVSTASGAFLPASIAGTASNTSLASGAITLLAKIAGTAASTSSATGAFLPASIAGTATTVSSATGAITSASGPTTWSLAGTAVATSTASGTLNLILTFAGPANSFEGGTSGTTVSPANSGGSSGVPFDSVFSVANGTLAYDNSRSAHGGQSCQVATGATAGTYTARWTTALGPVSLPVLYFRIYLYAAGTTVWRPLAIYASGVHAASILWNGSVFSYQRSAGFVGTQNFTNPLPLNQWCRVEGYVIGDSVNGTISVSLYLSPDSIVPDETKTTTGIDTSGLITEVRIGQNTNVANTGPFWFDDPAVSGTGPLGPFVTTAAAGSAITRSQASGAFLPASAAGTASNTSSASGAFLPASIAGTASTTSLATGALTLTAVIAGTASNTSTAVGAFLPAPIAGTAITVSVASGALTLRLAIAGTAVSASSATGAFLPASIAGTAVTVSSASGAITAGPGPAIWSLAGTAAKVSTASGTLTLLAAIAGTSVNASAASGALTLRLALAGTAITVSAATGVLAPRIDLAGTAVTVSVATGVLFLRIPLAGTAVTVSVATGFLVLRLALAGTARNVSTATGVIVSLQLAVLPEVIGCTVRLLTYGALVSIGRIGCAIQVQTVGCDHIDVKNLGITVEVR